MSDASLTQTLVVGFREPLFELLQRLLKSLDFFSHVGAYWVLNICTTTIPTSGAWIMRRIGAKRHCCARVELSA